MHAITIQDLSFLEEQSGNGQIVGGTYKRPKVSTSVSTSVSVKKDVGVEKSVTRDGYKLSYSFDAYVELGAGVAGSAAGSLGDLSYTTAVTTVY